MTDQVQNNVHDKEKSCMEVAQPLSKWWLVWSNVYWAASIYLDQFPDDGWSDLMCREQFLYTIYAHKNCQCFQFLCLWLLSEWQLLTHVMICLFVQWITCKVPNKSAFSQWHFAFWVWLQSFGLVWCHMYRGTDQELSLPTDGNEYNLVNCLRVKGLSDLAHNGWWTVRYGK